LTYNTSAAIDFLSKQCKNNEHIACCGLWEGLGFKVLCDCKCHKKKEQQQALAEVVGPETNAVENKPSLEVKQDD
jgi:hypothetical protein